MKIGVFSVIILILSGSIAYSDCDGGNSPPEARLTADPTYVAVDVNITFDGSGSYDTDGTITKYEWQWITDGSWEDTNTTKVAIHDYNTPGSYTVTLKVTDDANATDIDTYTVTV